MLELNKCALCAYCVPGLRQVLSSLTPTFSHLFLVTSISNPIKAHSEITASRPALSSQRLLREFLEEFPN